MIFPGQWHRGSGLGAPDRHDVSAVKLESPLPFRRSKSATLRPSVGQDSGPAAEETKDSCHSGYFQERVALK